MRLAQIARKLKVKSTKIVDFIEHKFEIQIPHAPNTKIPDEYIDDILVHFTPEETEAEVASLDESKEETPVFEPKVKERSEERRVGKECRSRRTTEHSKKKIKII